MSQQTLGYLLIALGIIVAITGIISYKKGGRMKLVTYIVFVVVSLSMGIKFAFSTEKKPMEIKEIVLPQNPGRK